MSINQNPVSLDDYKKSLDYLFKVKNTRIAAKKLLEMGHEQKDLMNYEEAREKYFVAFKVYQDEKNILGEAMALKSIGDVCKIENRFSEARKYYWKGLNKINVIGNRRMENNILKLISSCYQAEGSLQEAARVQNKIEELNLSTNQSKVKLQQSVLINSHQLKKLKNKLEDISPTRYQSLWLICYILILLFAELITSYYSTTWGIIIEIFLIASLITTSISTKSIKFSYLLQAMILLPLIRIISLNIPVIAENSIYGLAITAVPIIIAVFILMKNQNISRKKAGLIIGNLPLQLIFGLTGIAMGIIEYLIIKPTILLPGLNHFIISLNSFTPSLNFINIILASSIILISTGFLEELIFRGIIQRLAENIVGNLLGIIFASVLFTILNIGWNSPLNVIFIFLVSLYYGLIYQKTRSIFGIGISHGLCNVVLYLVLPFLV